MKLNFYNMLKVLDPQRGLLKVGQVFLACILTVGISHGTYAQSCSGPPSLPYFEDFESGSSLSDYPCWAGKNDGRFDEATVDDANFSFGTFSGSNCVVLEGGSDLISPELPSLSKGKIKVTFYLAFEEPFSGSNNEGFEIGVVDQQPSPSGSYSNYTTYKEFTYVSGNPSTSNYEFTDDEKYRKYSLTLSDKSKLGGKKYISFNRESGGFDDAGIDDVTFIKLLDNDITPIAFNAPQSSCKFPGGTNVEVEYKTKGTKTLTQGTSFQVSYTFQGNQVTETHTVSRDIDKGGTFTHTFNPTINPNQDNTTYSLSTSISWSNDEKSSNDDLSGDFRNQYNSPQPSVIGDTVCNTNRANLKVANPVMSDRVTYLWFNRPNNGLNIGTGDSVQTPRVYAQGGTANYYVKRRDSLPDPLKITEVKQEDDEGVEVQHMLGKTKDYTGYTVVLAEEDDNTGRFTEVLTWDLGSFGPYETKAEKESGGEFSCCVSGFGEIAAFILDPNGNVVDYFAAFDNDQVSSTDYNVKGYNITSSDLPWNGPAYTNSSFPSPVGFYKTGDVDKNDASQWNTGLKSFGSRNPGFKVRRGTCPSDPKTVPVDVRPIPKPGFTTPDTICATNPVTINDTTLFTGPTSLDYEWEVGQDAEFTVPSPQYTFPQSAGQYSVKLKVTSQQNCRDSIKKNVEVNAEPTAVLDTITGCARKDVLLSDQSDFPGFGDLRYSWNTNNTRYQGANPAVNYPSDGQYQVDLTVTSPAGCVDDTSNVAVINPTPETMFTVADTCQDDPVTLQNQVSFNGNNSNLSYQWNFGNGNGAQMANPSPVYDTNGQYDIALTARSDKGCAETMEKMVNIDPKPFPSISVDRTCTERQVELSTSTDFGGDPNNLAYNWSLGDNSGGTGASLTHTYPDTVEYPVELTSTNTDANCSNTIVRDVKINPQPKPTFSTNDVCQGQPTDFQYTGGTPAGTYSYDFGDGVTSAKANPDHVYSRLDTFMVALSISYNGQECRATNTQEVTVNPVPEAQFAFAKGAICAGDTVSVNNQTNFEGGSSSALDYEWDFGGETTLSGANPTYSFDEGGIYDVSLTASTNEGCTSSVMKSKAINALPTADFNITTISPSAVKLTAKDGTYRSYMWDVGDTAAMEDFNKPEITYSYGDTTNYSITLTVEDRKGCKKTVTKSYEPFTGILDIEEGAGNQLSAYPNPFSGQVSVKYQLNKASSVRIDVLSVDGKQLVTKDYGQRTPGKYSFDLNANKDLQGGGPYMLRLQIGDDVYTKQLIRAE